MSELNKFENVHIIEGRGLKELVDNLRAIENPFKVLYIDRANAQGTRYQALIEVVGKPKTKKRPTVEQAKETQTISQ